MSSAERSSRNWRDRPTVLVASREINERIRRRGYWIFLAVTMAAIAAIIVIPSLLSSGSDEVHVVVVGSASAAQPLRQAVQAAGRAQDIEVKIRDVESEDAARSVVAAGDADVAVVAPDRLVVASEPGSDDTSSTARFLNAVSGQLQTRAGLAQAGITAEQIARLREAPAPKVVALRSTDPDQGPRRASATVLNVLLLLLLQLYGSWVLNGVTEEKTSRVAEVLLSSTGPRPLLFGKLIGVGVAALLNGALLVVTAVAAAAASGSNLLGQIDVATLPWGLTWLMLGYGFYCCVYAAVGSTVTRVEEAQSAAFPILLPLLFTYILAFGVIFADTPPLYFRVLAYLPPTAPIAMAVLQASGQASWWEAVISMVICLVGIVLMARLAAAVYRGSILHTGGRIKFREALRNDDMVGDRR